MIAAMIWMYPKCLLTLGCQPK